MVSLSCLSAKKLDNSDSRPFGLLERWTNLALNLSECQALTYLYRYPASELPSSEYLHQRVQYAQRQVHHLWTEIVDGQTPKPYLRLRPGGPWACAQLVRNDTFVDQAEKAGSETEMEARLLEVEFARMKARSGDGGPLWQITRYTVPTVDRGSGAAFAYIALSAWHQVLDGMGALNLSLAILSDIPIAPAPGLAPRLEDIVWIGPSLPYLAKEAYQEFVVPYLPASLAPKPWWPGRNVNGRTIDFPEAQAATLLPSSWIPALKREGLTLNPILETALVLALRDVMSFDDPVRAFTAVDERTADCPVIGGVIVSVLSKLHRTLPSLPSDISCDEWHPAFWSLARETAQAHTPRGRRHARYTLGMLGYAPDPKSNTPFASGGPHASTGFDAFFLNGLKNPAPFRYSLAVSNLGKVKTLPPGVIGMRWSQSSSPFESPLEASVAGHELGIAVSLCFRDGCVLTRKDVERVMRRFEEILGSLAGNVA